MAKLTKAEKEARKPVGSTYRKAEREPAKKPAAKKKGS